MWSRYRSLSTVAAYDKGLSARIGADLESWIGESSCAWKGGGSMTDRPTIPNGIVPQNGAVDPCAVCGREVPTLGTVSMLCDRCKAVLRVARTAGIEQPHLPLTRRREFCNCFQGRATKHNATNPPKY